MEQCFLYDGLQKPRLTTVTVAMLLLSVKYLAVATFQLSFWEVI